MSMSSIRDTNDSVFTKKMLIIPDYVIPSDMPKIYHYFDYYNIASLKNVEIKSNMFDSSPLNSKYIFSNDFGHAIIEIDEWQNNNSAYWFYEAIENNKCRMIYDDPDYWDLEFYVKLENNYKQDHENQNEVLNENHENIKLLQEDDQLHQQVVDDEDGEVFDYSYIEKQESVSSEFDSDSYSEYESNSELDDPNDDDYIFEESDNDKDNMYEYYNLDHNKSKHFTRSKSNKGNNKRKLSVDAEKEIKQLKEENDILKTLLIKKNKNYLKNNKSKTYKNDWTRRLRQKVSY